MRRLLSGVDTKVGPDRDVPADDILENLDRAETTPAKVDDVAKNHPEVRHYLFWDLANEEREDLIPERFNSIEDQAIASFARDFSMEYTGENMPAAYKIIERLSDHKVSGSFFVVEFDDPCRDGATGVGLVGPIDETRLPYREVTHAFAREGDTVQSVSGLELIKIWREEFHSALSSFSYRYPSDPPKNRSA